MTSHEAWQHRARSLVPSGASITSPASALQNPDIADRLGDYRLLFELGAGRTGVSYLALPKDCSDPERAVVVRALRHEYRDEPPIVEMFLEQARLAARLVHRNIARTIEVGAHGGRPFVALERLNGQPLQRIFRRTRERGVTIPTECYLRVARDTLSALDFAHSLADGAGNPLGLVHREVSPAKVFVTYDGHIKVVDFGVSTATPLSDSPTVLLTGSVRYMAPEHAAGEAVDARSDIFSVGVLLWESLFGHPPWDGLPDVLVLENLLAGRIPRPSEGSPNVDLALSAIIERAMASDPDARYPSARAMRDDLERYEASRQATARFGSFAPGFAQNRLTVREALGALVSELFENDARSLARLVDGHLPAATAERDPGLATSGVRPHGAARASSGKAEARTPPGPAGPAHGRSAAPPSATAQYAAKRTPVGGSSRRPRGDFPRVAVAASAGVATLLAGALFLSLHVAGGPTAAAPLPFPPPASPASPAVAPEPAAPSPPASPMARITIRVSPPTAHLFVDDSPVPNPFTMELPSEDGLHHIRAEAAGYAPKARDVSFKSDMEIEMELGPRPAPSRRARSAPPSPPAATRASATAAEPPGLDPDVAPEVSLGIDKRNPYQP